MKITSAKELCFALVVGGGGLIWNIVRNNRVLVIFCAALLVRGLWLSFSQEAYDEMLKKRKEDQKLQQQAFGKFAPVVDFVPVICIVLGGLLAIIFNQTLFIKIILSFLLIFAFGFMVYESFAINKERNKPKDSQTEI